MVRQNGRDVGASACGAGGATGGRLSGSQLVKRR
jgi:hypothetical protein